MIEALDARRLFAGIVNVTFPNDSILITGDSRSNSFIISDDHDRKNGFSENVFIEPTGTTRIRINGNPITSRTVITKTFGKDLFIDLGDGNDTVGLNAELVQQVQFGNASISMGNGDDAIAGLCCSFNNLAVDTAGGNDRIRFYDNTIVTGSMTINTGLGRDSIMLDTIQYRVGPQIRKKLRIQDTSGPTSIVMGQAYVGRSTLISTGNSLDHIRIQHSSFGGGVVIGTHRGDDVIKLPGTFFYSTKDIFPGPGNDVISP